MIKKHLLLLNRKNNTAPTTEPEATVQKPPETMLALSPLFSSGFGWNFDDHPTACLEHPITQNNNDSGSSNCFMCSGEGFSPWKDNSTGDINAAACIHRHDSTVLPSPLVSRPTTPLLAAAGGSRDNIIVGCSDDQSSLPPPDSSDDVMASAVVRKLNHNASERDRRRKINALYFSLRSLLPPSNHTKKLSIPATVSRVLKYIPELQKEVEELIRRKDELLLRINSTRNGYFGFQKKGMSQASTSTQKEPSLCSVQATQISSAEIIIQISTLKFMHQTIMPFSEVLREIEEEDGLLIIDISSFESFGGRVFYSVHLLVEGTQTIKGDAISGKLLSCYKKWGTLYQWTI